ncbi:MAG: hypothetical protein KDE01_18905, partial [Caldilineaceae bacterium]|nr:hypothetical protein [Caldilineaceae bacterium]
MRLRAAPPTWRQNTSRRFRNASSIPSAWKTPPFRSMLYGRAATMPR